MQRTNNNNMAKSAGRRVGSSTTLNRKYVKRPKKKAKTPLSASTKRSSKIQRFNREDMEPSQTVVSISSLHEKDLDDRKDGMKNVSSIESSLIQDDFNNPSLPKWNINPLFKYLPDHLIMFKSKCFCCYIATFIKIIYRLQCYI